MYCEWGSVIKGLLEVFSVLTEQLFFFFLTLLHSVPLSNIFFLINFVWNQ